jgi:hypothetical protein
MLTKFHYITNLKKWLQVGFRTFYRDSESSPFNRSPWVTLARIGSIFTVSALLCASTKDSPVADDGERNIIFSLAFGSETRSRAMKKRERGRRRGCQMLTWFNKYRVY